MKTVAVLSAVVLLYIASAFFYPDVSRFAKHNPEKTAFMEYRQRQWADAGRKMHIIKSWVPLSRVSPFLIKAVLIGEDDKFWGHGGFDFDAIETAVEKDIKAGKLKFGASTISQQLAKNLFLSPSKNPVRKIREAILTWRLENKLSKRRILELYLNSAEWGDGIFGIEEAARHYYGKPAAAIGPDEAAHLAAVLPNPIKFNPLGASRYVQNRSRIIYNIMVRRGIVIPEYEDVMKAAASQSGNDNRSAGADNSSADKSGQPKDNGTDRI